MSTHLPLIVAMLLLPAIYFFGLMRFGPVLPFRHIGEEILIGIAEAALVSVWRKEVVPDGNYMMFWLLFVTLAGMTVLYMTDSKNQTVPNGMLLLMLAAFVWIVGFQGVRDMDTVVRALPSIVMGFLFCLISFGMGYFFSHGGMGAGDVKLALVMGLMLTGKYVVGTVLYGCIIAAVYSIIQMIRKELTREDKIPFVPFLYVGLIIKYFVG